MPAVRRALLFLLLAGALTGAACREDGVIQISSLTFEGVEQVDKDALASALQTRKGSRLPWGRKRYFDRTAFEADLQRMQVFYRDRGFPDARVTSFDVALNDAQDQVDVTVRIAEGEPIVVSEIALNGFDLIPADDQAAIRETLPLQPERPLDRQAAVATRERMTNELRDQGYAYAQVTLAEEELGPRRRRIVLAATPGPLTYFGPVEVVGSMSVDQTVVLRQITFQPGEVFTREKMRETQRALYRLELFEFVNVESLEDRTNLTTQVPIKVTVAEAKHQKVTAGIGYGTEEQARATLRWDHVNFLGNARHAGVEAKWSSLDRGIRLDFREPFFLAQHFSLNFDGEAWQAREPVYDLDSLGGRITLRHQANSRDFWAVSLNNEFQRSEITNEALLDFTIRDDLIALGLDPRTGESRGTLSSVSFDIERNTASNILDARSGYVLNGHVEQAGKWLWGTYNFWSVTGEGRHYVSLGSRAVVANRLRIGTIVASADLPANVPFYKRYFLGGASSLRGWGRFEVSPLSGFGLPLGGLTMLEGSSEVRAPLFGKLSAAGFLDFGNVWSGDWAFDPSDLRFSVGPGLRYLTPIGPARLDFGYQLTPIEGLRVNGELEPRHWRLHISIGQAF